MPFNCNAAHNNKISQQNQLKSPKTNEKQIVVYQGRRVTKLSYDHIQTSVDLNSLINRIFVQLAGILEVTPNQLSDMIPPSFISMFNKLGEMVTQVTEQTMSPNMTVEQEIQQEEENAQMHEMVLNQMNQQLKQLGLQRQKQLRLAGVASGKELMEKEKSIAIYREKAEKRYLQNPLNLETRHKIDKALIIAYKGMLSSEDEAIIDKYWEFVSTAFDGFSKMKAIKAYADESLEKALTKSFTLMTEHFTEEKLQLDAKSKVQFIVDYFNTVSLSTAQQLMEKRQIYSNNGDQAVAVIDYILLIASFQMTSMMNELIKNLLNNHLERLERDALTIIKYYRESNARQIQNQENFILSYKGDIYQIHSNDACAKILLESRKVLQELQSMTEEDFKDQAYEFLGENPNVIKGLKAFISQVTPFEVLYSKFMNIESQDNITDPNAAMFSVSQDIQLNLKNMENPEEYFIQQIADVDRKKLALLMPKMEV